MLSIRSFKMKLLLIIWACSSAIMLFASGCFIFFAITEFNRNLNSEIEIVLNSITDKSARAIMLNDPALAEDALFSAAETVSFIENAVTYDRDENVFAYYMLSKNSDSNDFAIPEPQENKIYIKDRYLHVFRDISLYSDRVGTIYIRASRDALYDRIQQYIVTVVGIMGVLLLFIAAISFFLQRLVSTPVIALTASAKEVAENKDYSIRVQKQSDDELGILADSFNEMLTQIQEKINDLTQSEQRFRVLLDNISSAVFLHDSEGRVLDVNKTMMDLYGVTREEALTMNITDHFSGPENQLEDLPDVWQRVLSGESVTFEWNAQKPHSGECFPIDVWLKSVSFGTKKLVLATVRDLSIQKMAESQLLKEKKFTETLINTLPGIFYVYEEGERLIQWNKNFEEKSGYTYDEMFNKKPLEWFDDKNRPLISKALQKGFDEGEFFVEADVLFKDASAPYYLTGKMLTVDDKKYLIGVGLDLSKRRELEEELAQARKMEAIGTLAGGIAHDFNNILSAILGYSELISMEDTSSENKKQYINEVLIATKRAKELVKQILTFSRKSGHEKQPLQLAPILKEVLKLLRSSIPTTIEIKQNIESQAVIYADPISIHQVIMNLCTNAYHAMRSNGGTLVVSLKEVSLDEVSLKYLDSKMAHGKYLKLEVSDTGCGMDDNTKNKIFEPYFTTKKAGEGTGLGLAVVHGIIKDHQGGIYVYSELGRGTSFHVYLPITEESSKEFSLKIGNEVIRHGDNEYIMVVDDEEQISNLLVGILSKYGYKVKAFQNGVQALQEFKEDPEQFDLIITDLTMPFMTGIEFAKEILQVRPEMPIILNSGYSEMLNREKALAIGIKEYCEKPLKIDAILQVVRKTLDDS